MRDPRRPFRLGLFRPSTYPHDQISLGVLVLSWIVAVFIVVKHRANIVRLMNGTENGFGSKRKKCRLLKVNQRRHIQL